MKFIALLRGINVGGTNRLPMDALRTACEGEGWSDVATYIQSGNILFSAKGPQETHESALEKLIEREFGLTIPVIVRSNAQWAHYVEANPFAKAAEEEPNRLLLCLPKTCPNPDAAAMLDARAQDGEQVRQTGDAFWIHFPCGSGKSKLTPGLIDRAAGSPVTTRNWRTVLKLRELSS